MFFLKDRKIKKETMSFCLHLITRPITKIDRMPILNMKSNLVDKNKILNLKDQNIKNQSQTFKDKKYQLVKKISNIRKILFI